MKLLFVNGHLHVGGVEKSLINLLKSIDYTQHQVDLLLLEDLGEYESEVPPGVHIYYYDLRPTYGSVKEVVSRAFTERNLTLLRRKIAITVANKLNRRCLRLLDLPEYVKGHYDCAIAYRVGMPLDLVSFVIKADVKCAWWHHGEFQYPEALVKKWDYAFKQMNHIICVSEASKRMIEPFFPELQGKMQVMPNIIIPEEIRKAADAYNPYESEFDKTILVSVGRMSEEKHMADTVDVMQVLKKRGHNDLVWCLVGDGIERRHIETKISDYGLQDSFRLVGNQENPYIFIKNADFFIHPSWVESQGICVLEAMALEKPCIVVSSEGTDEFVVDGYNAFRAEKSINDMADKIEYAICNAKETDFQTGEKETLIRFLPAENMPKLYDLMSRG